MPRKPIWTLEDLEREAPNAVSRLDLCRRLGLKGASSIKGIFRVAEEHSIDVSHIQAILPFGKGRSKLTDAELETAVAQSFSVSEVLRRGGYLQAGGSHAALSARIKGLGLDTSHFGTNGKAPVNKKSPKEILTLLPPGSRRCRTDQLRRAMQAAHVVDECTECGIGPEWNGRPLTLQIEHLNGDSLDNRIENLCFLCPNCHTQTATYARKKGAA